MNLRASLSKCSLPACLLAFGLTHADAQTQIIGYNNSKDLSDITDLTNSPFTTFIDGFIQPTGTSTADNPSLGFDTLGFGGTMDAARVAAFNSAEDAGKNVLLSFGGAGAGSSYSVFANGGTTSGGTTYTAAQATQTLANVLAAYVTGASSYTNAITNTSVPITTYDHSGGTFRGFSGIDLDFEDTQSFQTGGTYNGAQFISQLTLDLRNQLGGSYLITQAPQTPYLDPNFTQNGGSYASTGAYQAIMSSAAGAATKWLNVQFYNNPGDDGNNSVSGIVAAFERLVTANPNISSSKFILTLPVNQQNANDNFFTQAQITEIFSEINDWLHSQGKPSIAGIAGFELYNGNLAGNQSQMDANNLAFANAFIAGVPEPSTWAFAAGGVGLMGWTLRRRFSAARC